MVWVFITAGGTYTHILGQDPSFAVKFCGTVCLLCAVQLLLRLLALDFDADGGSESGAAQYLWGLALGLSGLGMAFFGGYVFKGYAEWEKQLAVLREKEKKGAVAQGTTEEVEMNVM